MTLELFLAFIMLVSLTFYVLMGGADYGGGVWDLFAFGARKKEQRELIAHAIGPIWEANHVWIILVIVLLFTAFPSAYAAVSIACHVPLTLMLIGIVLRGSAFTFRTYDSVESVTQLFWGRIFAIASLLTPIAIGIVIGAISSNRIHQHHIFDFVSAWLTSFSFVVGFMTVALFAFLAAVYLAFEAEQENKSQLADDFAKRAIAAQLFLALMSFAAFCLAEKSVPDLWITLVASPWAIPLQVITALLAITSILALLKKHYKAARFMAVGQTTLILWGWAFAQFPFLVRPEITIFNAAAPAATLNCLAVALALGGLILFPSFYYLFFVFKQKKA